MVFGGASLYRMTMLILLFVFLFSYNLFPQFRTPFFVMLFLFITLLSDLDSAYNFLIFLQLLSTIWCIFIFRENPQKISLLHAQLLLLWYTIDNPDSGVLKYFQKRCMHMLFTQTQKKLCSQTIHAPDIGRITTTLLEDTLPDGLQQYSITVQLCSNASLEEHTVPNVTTNKQFAMQLFWQICRGTVTPCTLTEVLSELIP